MNRRRKGEETREEILQKAEQLFAQKGYAATTLDDISAIVGIKRPSLLYYFPDKYSIYQAVIKNQYERQFIFINLRERREFSSATEYLAYLLDRSVDYYTSHGSAAFRVDLFNLLSDMHEEVNPRHLAVGSVNLWRDALKEGIATGEFRDIPLIHLLALVGGMIGHYMLISPSVALIDPKLGYATLDRRNINRMRQSVHAAMWGLLHVDAPKFAAAPRRKARAPARAKTVAREPA